MKNFLNKIGLFITNLVRSLDNKQESGYSARKLTAFGAFVYACYLANKLEEQNRLHAIYALLLIALLCLGIVTVEQIIKFKTGATTNADKPTQ